VGGNYPSVFYDIVFVGDNLIEFWLTLGKRVFFLFFKKKKHKELEWDHDRLNHEFENLIKVNHAMRAKNKWLIDKAKRLIIKYGDTSNSSDEEAEPLYFKKFKKFVKFNEVLRTLRLMLPKMIP
jgi:hypothetical protein